MRMDKQLGKEIPITGRREFLRDNCDAVVTMGYVRRLSHDELRERKDELSDTDIKINDIEEEKKAATEKFKLELKPLKEQRRELLKALKEKGEYVKEEACYKFIYEDEKMVAFYNGEGDLIDFRPMTGEEAQASLFRANRKTGTDN